jgi:hypothetical protein
LVRPPTIEAEKVTTVITRTVTDAGVFAVGTDIDLEEISSVPVKLAFTRMTVLFKAEGETKNLICAPIRPLAGTYIDPIVTFTAVCEPAYDDPLPVKAKVIVPRFAAMPPVFLTLTVARTHRFGAVEVEFKVTVSTMMFACDLILTIKGLTDAAFNTRLVISSAPVAVELMETAAVVALDEIVTSRSMNPAPRIVFVVEMLVDMPV